MRIFLYAVAVLSVGCSTMTEDDGGSWERIQFGGKLMVLAMDEFAGSFNHDTGNRCMDALYRAYQDAGTPPLEPWARQQLSMLFRYLDQRPRWVESEPSWPFLNQKPMVFVCQYSVPDTEVARDALTTEVELYVFGTRLPDEDGGTIMKYEVVSQYAELKDIKAILEVRDGVPTVRLGKPNSVGEVED